MPLSGSGGELDRCEASDARVRSVGVVVDPPFFDELAGLRQVGEQMFVKALVAQPTASKASAMRTASSGVMPSGPTRSFAEIRTDIGLWEGHTAPMGAKTSNG